MCGLYCEESWPKSCAGTVLADCQISLLVKNKLKGAERGEVLLTGEGISGPAVLDIAGGAGQAFAEGKPMELALNLHASRKLTDWQRLFSQWRLEQGKKLLKNILCYEFNHNLALALMAAAGVNTEVKICEITAVERDALLEILVNAKLHLNSLSPWSKAMVTHGGVALKTVNPQDLSSKIVPKLYFAGEILNLDGPCGGYNLQWAFSSGFLVGNRVAIK